MSASTHARNLVRWFSATHGPCRQSAKDSGVPHGCGLKFESNLNTPNISVTHMYHDFFIQSRVSTHMESIDKMDKRSDSLKSSRQSTSRRSKRRSDHKDVSLNTWDDNRQNGSANYYRDPITGLRFPPRTLMQSRVSQANSQRLHSALSDPGVCGYSPVSLTYTMQPVSLPPVYGLYSPSVQVPFPEVGTFHDMFRRECNAQSKVRPDNANSNVANNCDNQRKNYLDLPTLIDQRNGDYASLPPAAESGINSDELNAEHRRYSDPGLGPANITIDSDSEESVESDSSNTTTIRYNKLLLTLVEQISDLKKYNSDLFKKLNETKRYVETLTAESAQRKHYASSDYQPGMLSEIVREIRTANKKCEEGLVMKVETMMDEMRNEREKEMEEFKNQISILRMEKEESEKRVANLEEELAALKLNITNGGREIAAFEEETLVLRRELQEARASRNLAENHAAKCVNLAVSTPVNRASETFDMSGITSTPVRTALADTRSLSSSYIPEVMQMPVDSTTNSLERMLSIFASDARDCDRKRNILDPMESPTELEDFFEKMLKPYWLAVKGNDAYADGTSCNKIEGQSTRSVDVSEISQEVLVESVDHSNIFKSKYGCDDDFKASSKETKEKCLKDIASTLNDQLPEKYTEVITDESDKSSSHWDTMSGDAATSCSCSNVTSCSISNEDDDSPTEDDHANRAIAEVPDVAVISGGSFVPKDLCSTRILTSRVLTAPSRATYTTAYI